MAFPVPGTPQLIAPSFVGPYYAREAPRPVTREEIAVLVRQFGDAARRMRRAGADGVEIHAAHAHGLLGGFLSPLYNKRTDEYGGDIDGRLKLTLDVVREVRERCGRDFIVDVRISGDEYSDGGLTLTDMCYVSRQLERAGVDMLHVSGGTTIKRGSAIPAPGTKQGSHAALSEQIKRCVSIPVATVGRINEAWVAEELLEEGKADACMMGRANICDSEFCNKAAAGKTADIRPCIGCLRCLTGIMFGKPIACTVNPDVEGDDASVEAAPEPRDVLVVGAGPAGMEAAFVAARRGHHVVLADAADELGGTMRIAAVPIAKQDLTRVTKFMARRLNEAGVEVRLGTCLSAEDIERDYAGYEVVLACGSTPIVPGFATAHKQACTADDILSGRVHPGRRIVVVGGGSVGCEVADYLAPTVNDLAKTNRDVTVVEMGPALAPTEGAAGRAALVTRMLGKGVHALTDARVTEVSDTSVTYECGGETCVIEGVDTLVLALGYRADRALADDLCARGIATRLIGDAEKPGNIKDAVAAAYALAREL